MTTPQESQPQDAVIEGSAQEGASVDASPQTEGESDGHQPGAEQQEEKKSPSERTYTQAEWSARESAKDKEIAETRRQLASLAQGIEQDRATATEFQARTADARRVDEGSITSTEAVQLQHDRASRVRTDQDRTQAQADKQNAQDMQEYMARVDMARNLEKEHGVDADTLINDTRITTPGQMTMMAEMMAERVALDKQQAELKGTESYDDGQQAARGGGTQSYVQKLKDGGDLPSAADIDRLTARYLTRRS